MPILALLSVPRLLTGGNWSNCACHPHSLVNACTDVVEHTAAVDWWESEQLCLSPALLGGCLYWRCRAYRGS